MSGTLWSTPSIARAGALVLCWPRARSRRRALIAESQTLLICSPLSLLKLLGCSFISNSLYPDTIPVVCRSVNKSGLVEIDVMVVFQSMLCNCRFIKILHPRSLSCSETHLLTLHPVCPIYTCPHLQGISLWLDSSRQTRRAIGELLMTVRRNAAYISSVFFQLHTSSSSSSFGTWRKPPPRTSRPQGQSEDPHQATSGLNLLPVITGLDDQPATSCKRLAYGQDMDDADEDADRLKKTTSLAPNH